MPPTALLASRAMMSASCGLVTYPLRMTTLPIPAVTSTVAVGTVRRIRYRSWSKSGWTTTSYTLFWSFPVTVSWVRPADRPVISRTLGRSGSGRTPRTSSLPTRTSAIGPTFGSNWTSPPIGTIRAPVLGSTLTGVAGWAGAAPPAGGIGCWARAAVASSPAARANPHARRRLSFGCILSPLLG
jgi:hypothetical protein